MGMCLDPVVERFLDQYDGLIVFFSKEVNDSKLRNMEAKIILDKLKNPYFQIMFIANN